MCVNVCVSCCWKKGGSSVQRYNLRHHSVWKSLRDPSHPSRFFFPQSSCPDSPIAGWLPEETHGLFKHSQRVDWTPLLPGEHFLYPHVTCHKICLTATDSRSQTGSVITGLINSPMTTHCLLSTRLCYLVTQFKPLTPWLQHWGLYHLFSWNVYFFYKKYIFVLHT